MRLYRPQKVRNLPVSFCIVISAKRLLVRPTITRRAVAKPTKVTPNQGKTGTRSLLIGGVCENPIHATQRLSNASLVKNSGASHTTTPIAKMTRVGRRKKANPRMLATAIA